MTLHFLIKHQYAKFSSKEFSSLEDTEWTNTQWMWSSHMTLTLKTAIKTFPMILWFMIMHHHNYQVWLQKVQWFWRCHQHTNPDKDRLIPVYSPLQVHHGGKIKKINNNPYLSSNSKLFSRKNFTYLHQTMIFVHKHAGSKIVRLKNKQKTPHHTQKNNKQTNAHYQQGWLNTYIQVLIITTNLF